MVFFYFYSIKLYKTDKSCLHSALFMFFYQEHYNVFEVNLVSLNIPKESVNEYR